MSDIDAFLDAHGAAEPESQIDSFLGKPESSGTARRLLGDTGVSLMKGLASVPETIVGLADIPTGGRAGQLVDKGLLSGFDDIQNYWGDLYSLEQKAANQRVSDADGFLGTAGAMLENPSTIAHGVVESLPAMLAGGVVGRGLGVVSKLPAFARGAIGEGIVGAGLSAEGIRQQTDDGLLSPLQSAAAAATGAGTSLFGAGGARLAQRLGIGDIDTLLAGGATQQSAKGVARSAAEGAVVEGALQELPQSMQEQALQNIALGRPVGEGVGSAAAAGLLTGGVVGGIAGPLGSAAGVAGAAPQPVEQGPAGPIGRVAQMLPAPERLALPAPEPVFVADGQGNVSEQGQVRDVDREQRPVPGRTPGNGGPGMDQQTSRGVLPLSGELMPAAPSQQRKSSPEPRTFDAEPVRLGLPDLRPEAVIVDSEGSASVERTATPAPAKPRVDGMEAQAKPGQKPKFEQVLQRARAAGAQADAAALAAEIGATRAQAARAIRGAQAEQQIAATTYKSVPGANKAMRELPQPDAFEVIKSGNREWRIQPRQEVPSVDSRAGADDVGAAGNLPATPDRTDNVAGVPVVAERAPTSAPAAEQGGLDIPAAVEKPDGKRSLSQPDAKKKAARNMVGADGSNASNEVPGGQSLPAGQSVSTRVEPPAAQSVQSGPKPGKPSATKAEESLPDILATPRKRYIERQAKAAGIKEGSPGYAAAAARLESEYESQVDDAQAALPFEQYNALNKESPEGVNRQAWTQLRKERGIETVAAPKAKPIAGKDIDGDWSMFSKDSGSLNIPRADMPQIKAEHRGAMVNFLNARDIAHKEETIAADKLKPTQAEFSRKKVEKAKAFDGGDRSILISKDGHVLDGHHQWLAKRDAGEDVKVIRLDAPIRQLLVEVGEFPSATQDDVAPAASKGIPASKKPAEKLENFGEKLEGKREYAASSLSQELTDEQITAQPLSKIWPANEIDSIGDKFSAAMAYAARAEIPAKPRKGYKLGRWVDIVKTMRGLSAKVLNNQARARELLREMSGLEGFANKVELLEAVDRSQWKRIGKVGVYRDAYTFVDGEQVNSPFAQAEIDGKTQRFDGATSVADIVEGVNGLLEGAAQPKKMQFEIRRARGATVFDINKVGDKEYRSLKTLPSVKEARAFIEGNHAELVAAWEATKDSDNVKKTDVRGTENRPRAGADHRNGKDVTPDQFESEFGFRGVEFGNWVGQGANSKERQGMLNGAYDALMDLATLVGIPPKAVSLNGSLGLAFGSRGKGNAAAHFEPGNLVINLTKTKGAGVLAHEWFHALDNYFSRRRGGEVPIARGLNAQETYRQQNFITYRPEPQYVHKTRGGTPISKAQLDYYGKNAGTGGYYNPDNWHLDPAHPQGVRPEVEKAFADLVQALNDSPMSKRSALNDKSPNGYWGRIIERAARAFENFTISKMLERGYHNDYLANVRQVEDFPRSKARYPYLLPEEIAPISEAFDSLFDTIETKTDEAGNVALYSRASYRQGQPTKGSKVGQLRLQIASITRGWQNAPQVKVVQSIKDLPDAQRRQVERDGAFDVEGMFADGAVYLVADNLTDQKHAAFVLQHEVLGHAGLQGAYGARLKPLLMSIYNGQPAIKAAADKLAKKYDYDSATAVEEVLADMAADGSIQKQAFWPRLVTAMRNALRSMGIALQWSEGDIQALLANARRYIVNGRPRPGVRTAFSRDGRSGRSVEVADEQGRLLAPNGKPSKLGQKQWHQARSPQFKAWFGDWQAVETQKRLDAMKPLKLRTPQSWAELTEKERQGKVAETLKLMARDSEVLPHAQLGEVRMGMAGARKASSTAADPAKKAVLARLQGAFEHSIYASSSIDQQGREATAYHKMLAPIDIDGVQLVAVFTVREDANGRMFYNAVTLDRKEEAPAVTPGELNQEVQRSTPANTRAPADFVRQPLGRVNPADVSKVTDGNGEPLILHHGTAEEFFVFDQGRAGRSTGHTTASLGIFLSADASGAKAYAVKASDGMPGLAKVMDLYASIKKPYLMTVEESQSLDTLEKSRALRAKLEQQGHDGIHLKGTSTWVAFSNTQIKSATDNVGTFDEIDSDIRYSRAGYARDLFNRATGPAPLERNDPFAEENRRLREGEKTLWQKAKKEFTRQFAPGGLLPAAVFDEKITRDSEFQTVEFDVRHLSSGLNKAVKADFGVDLDNLTAEQMKPLAEALAGKVDPSIPEATRVAIVAMRQYIDSLSGEYLSILQKQVEVRMEGADQALIDKITGNLGSYVNRSYQAFDDPKWFKTVPTEVVNAARVYLAKGYIEQGETAAEAARLADVTVNEMLKNGTAYDSMGGFIAESKLGAKDLTVLIKRKEIAPEIRALLGEYMDPRLNFAKSATKMGRMVWNQRFLDRVLEFGMGTLFFEGKNRPADATTQIAGEQSESYAPLNGLWTFPEVAQSFQDVLGKEQMSDLYRTVVQLNGMVKYGKTILSPTTAMRNWQSAMFFSLANGHFDLTQMKKSWSAFREQVTQNATGEDLAYLRKLKQLGVVYDTPYAGEMMALMQDARMDELLSSKSGTGLKWLRKANQFAQGFYSFGDDFWKIIGFENEKASLVAAGVPVAEAETMAAERIRNTYPTYSMIGKAVQWLRRFPLAGTFVSFPSEIIRTTVGMMKLVNADLKSDNPKIRAIGRKRAAGMAMVSAGFYALSAMTAAALGVDDDEEEALRDLAAPWSKNSTFLYTGRDADGKLRYFDMSFLDPYGYWKRPLTAMMRDQPWQDAAASGISDMLSPFFGADITAGAIFEVLANKKPTGGQVYNENAGSVDQLQDISNHMRKALQPGFFSNAERLWKAGNEARREGSGQPYSMRDEVVSLLGWRAATLDTQTGLYYRSFDFTDALGDARKTLTRTLRSSNEVSADDIRESKEAANAQYQKAFTEMSRLVSAAGTAGMSRSQIAQTLKLSGVAQRNIFALLSGKVPPMEIGMQAQAKAVQQARVMRDSEHAAEIARRFRLAREK